MTFDDPTWRAQERSWLDALRRGDAGGFDRLFQAYAAPLYSRILLPRLGDPTSAEDALAETFRKAFERIGDYEERGRGLWAYLATIAINQTHDMHRQRARTGRALASFQALLTPLLGEAGGAATQDDAPDRARLRDAVERVLSAVNPRYRRAIELRFFEERPREECAVAMEVRLGTFDVLLLRALRAFREQWQKMVGASPEAA